MAESSAWSKERALLESELPLVQEVLRSICRRQGFSDEEGEEFTSWVIIKLMENDCAVLRKFLRRSSLKTYLTVVIQRLALDYRIKEWGKWRPSVSARALGPHAVRLEMLMHRDGLILREAVEMVLSSNRGSLDREDLLAIAEKLPVRRSRHLEFNAAVELLPSETHPADASVEEKERDQTVGRIEFTLNRLLDALSEEDRLLLKLRYIDQIQVRQIADALGLEPNYLYRKFESLQTCLRFQMEQAGIRRSDVVTVMGQPGRDIVLRLQTDHWEKKNS